MDLQKPRYSISKSFRMIKIKRKLKRLDANSEENEDYLLEKEGDIKNYLKSNNQTTFCPRYDPSGEIVAHSVIGPISLFSEIKDTHLPIKKSENLSRKKLKDEEIDPKTKFKQILASITYKTKASLQEEKKKLSSFSKREKLLEARQGQVMKNFQKTSRY